VRIFWQNPRSKADCRGQFFPAVKRQSQAQNALRLLAGKNFLKRGTTIMNILCYLDPFVTIDEPLLDRSWHLYVTIPVFSLHAKRNDAGDDVKLVLASDQLNRFGIKNELDTRQIPYISFSRTRLRSILQDSKISMKELIQEKPSI
jgi:hypothetical protein